MALRSLLSWFVDGPLSKLLASAVASILLMAGCTDYRPLDRGAAVPWAEALSAGKGGPIGQDRYRVGEGDALSVIAERYGLRLATLAAANNIESPYVLYPGEVLRIPLTEHYPARRPEFREPPPILQTALPARGEQPSAASPESPWPRKARVGREGASSPAARATAGRRYVVRSGESLSIIADRHGLKLAELVAANGIEAPYQISPGQRLVIPPSEADLRRQRVAAGPVGREQTGPLAPPPALSAEGFLWPVRGEVVSTFAENSAKGRSGGINIAASRGTPVRAADNGIVAYAGEALRGYGQMILIRHAEGYVTLYAHNDALLVAEGDVVRRGQVIAEVGDSGDVSDSQLHFELRRGAEPIDPAKILAGLPGRQIGLLQASNTKPPRA